MLCAGAGFFLHPSPFMPLRPLLLSLVCSSLLCACSGGSMNPFIRRQPCINGEILNGVCRHLSYAADLQSREKADTFAEHWREIETLIFLARETGLRFPQDISLAYNSTLELARRHGYYNSATLRQTMKASRPLSAAEILPEN